MQRSYVEIRTLTVIVETRLSTSSFWKLYTEGSAELWHCILPVHFCSGAVLWHKVENTFFPVKSSSIGVKYVLIETAPDLVLEQHRRRREGGFTERGIFKIGWSVFLSIPLMYITVQSLRGVS